MKKYILVLLILFAGILLFFIFKDEVVSRIRTLTGKEKLICKIDLKTCKENILKYLKLRKDSLALVEIGKALSVAPDDICALWAKAEVMRRNYNFRESEKLLNLVLSKCPDHASSLISLSYIRYHNNEFDAAKRLLKKVLRQPALDTENEALAYMLIGSINAKRSSLGGFLSKITYGTRIKGYFEKAKAIAPDLPEVRLGLGSFYLLAPRIVGGDVDKAIEELEYAVRIAPDFATANARLAQAYKKKGNLEKHNFYIQRTKDLDPENEALKDSK